MAGASLLTLLDDIAMLLDDVVISKVAAKKTAGVLGDDLAVNAEQLLGASLVFSELFIRHLMKKQAYFNRYL